MNVSEQQGGGVGDFIRAQAGEILHEWEEQVRQFPFARDLDRTALVDHVPALLERVAALADSIAYGQTEPPPREEAERHAARRHAEGFEPEELVLELSVLRACTMRRWVKAHTGVVLRAGVAAINQAVDLAVGTSVKQYVRRATSGRQFLDLARRDRAAQLESEIARRRELEAAVSALQDFVFLLDRERRFSWVNAAVLQFWGKTLAEVEGHDLQSLGYTTERAEAFRRQLDEVIAGKVVRGESVQSSAKGRTAHYEYILTPVRGPDGQVQSIAGISRDITERKQSEERQSFVRRAADRLGASLQLAEILSALVDLTLPGIADYVAVELVKGEGRSEQALAWHVRPELAQTERERRRKERPEPLVRQVLGSGRPELVGDAERELARELDLRSAVIVPMISHGRILGALTFGLGERGKYQWADLELAQELARHAATSIEHARLYRDAQEAVRARESVLAVVSHDLKNPLSAIGLSTTLLTRYCEQDAKARKHLSLIVRSSGRMMRLIDDLLDVASLQAGKLAVHRAAHKCRALMVEAVELHEQLAAEKGIAIACECELVEQKLDCDRERVMQVFGNLIGNALKFCERGDGISLYAAEASGYAEITVSDTGPGIAANELPRIFEPYWSAERYTKKGSGLGLYITRGIVEAQGGRIWAESVPGLGTSFHFTLPLSRG